MKINILGTEYQILHYDEEEYPKLAIAKADGIAELYSKKLIISKDLDKEEKDTYSNLSSYKNKVIRHEIVHAFFHEAGLMHYCDDEKLVDWIAIQIQKMYKVMEQAKCLD